MNKLSILLFVSFMITTCINCQQYNKFKFGLGSGFAVGKGTGMNDAGGGALLTIEPTYRLSDNLAVGLRLETAVFGEHSDDWGWPEVNSSITVNWQYYFNEEQFRPFIGAGLGIYFPGEISSFGFYPRFGFDFDHFTLALEYNLISASSNSESNAYYFGVRVGGFFFGGKK